MKSASSTPPPKAAPPASSSPRPVYYVLSSHWDREWYQPFQDYRYRLTQMLDRIIEGFETGALKGPFTLDGQAIPLEDYLEVRPGRRETVCRLLAEGKISAGPWYVQPDTFIVSGESLVRNLQLGLETVRAFGAQPSLAGVAVDLFGHNSQMPQLFAGIGVRAALLWRGVNLKGKRHFLWEGADGTVLPCFRFPGIGYCDFGIAVRKIADPNHKTTSEAIEKELAGYVEREASASEMPPVLLFDGADHQEWEPESYQYIQDWFAKNAAKYEFIHASAERFCEEVAKHPSKITTRFAGELRQPGQFPGDQDGQHQIQGVVSSRVTLKQQNAECQALLCHWAEPFSAMAHAALSLENPTEFLRAAWKWLLQNHPHDSICGCSVDQVHEDMLFRFSQTRQIAHRLTAEALGSIAAAIEGELGENEIRVTVFNPLPRPIEEPVDLTVSIPKDWPAFQEGFGYEPRPAFTIHNAAGGEIPYQRLGQTMNRLKLRLRYNRFAQYYSANDIRVVLPLRIPASGYTTLTVRRAQPHQTTRYSATPGLATSERSMENEFLAINVESNGSLTILDKRTNEFYSRLLTFEDCADIGDGWFWGEAINDQIFVSTASPAEVWRIHDGPDSCAFGVRVRMSIPAGFEYGDVMRRSARREELSLENRIRLRRGSDRVEIETILANSAEDHRLRVLFPSGAAEAASYLAETPFDVVERPIALPSGAHEYRELPLETAPQQSWTAVWDGERGLAIVNAGLHESAVRDQPERPIALTLLRAVQRTVGTSGEPEGQHRGTIEFHYWIVPLAAAPDRARLCEDGQRLAAGGPQSVAFMPLDLAHDRGELAKRSGGKAPAASLPPEAGFLTLEGQAVMTSCRAGEGALEVRLFNPEMKSIRAAIRLGAALLAAPGGAGGLTAARSIAVQRIALDGSPPLGPRPPRKRESIPSLFRKRKSPRCASLSERA